MSTGGSMIPSNVGKTIHDIKEIAGGKHSDDDIYAMLKECNMDPNDTAQKLLYLDTFHEVKRKRDRKKAKASNQSSEGYRWMSVMQRRGARNGRERISANYITDDSSGRRHVNKENGVNSLKDRSSKTSMPVAHKTNPHRSKESAIEVSADDPSYSRVASFVNVNKLAKVSTLPPNLINHHPNLDPGPTPAPTPTFAPGTRFQSKTVISRPNELVTSTTLALVSGVYSSASDPVLVPALNTRNSGIVGTIKREIGSQRTATESTVNEGRLDACQSPPRNTHSVVGTVHCINTAAPSIEPVVAINRESQHSNQVKGHSEVLPSQAAAVAKGAHLPSLSKLNSAMEKAVPQLDMKLEKLNISSRCQPVIFPNHLQVPESFRSGLTFGSLDPHFDPSISCGKDSMLVETVPANDRTSMETGRTNCSYQDASSAAQGGDYPDNPLSNQHGSENISPFEVSGASSVYDQSKPEVYAGSQLPLQTPLDYSLGFLPPTPGPQLVRIEGPEQQLGGNSQAPSMSCSNSFVAQPIGLGQSSVTVPPHLFPLVRQPFPPNYIPYNPYIPHLYMPQSAHQFLGPSGFLQQPSAANFYMSPSVTAAGVKLPLPSLYKPAAIAGNLNHLGVPTGYSSYGSSTVPYSATPAPVCPANNEDLTASELNENNVYSMQKQNEDSFSRTSAPGRDLSMLQANYFYNFPQDQHVAFAPAHSANSSYPGINPSQTIAVPSNVQPLAQQPQTVTGSVESDLPTSGAYQQPHANIHWNNKC